MFRREALLLDTSVLIEGQVDPEEDVAISAIEDLVEVRSPASG
jgi:hypothetical protein